MSKVYPVEGLYISGIPAVEHDCPGKGEHGLCLKSGAFTDKAPPKRAEAKPSQDPAGAGSLDSTEE